MKERTKGSHSWAFHSGEKPVGILVFGHWPVYFLPESMGVEVGNLLLIWIFPQKLGNFFGGTSKLCKNKNKETKARTRKPFLILSNKIIWGPPGQEQNRTTMMGRWLIKKHKEEDAWITMRVKANSLDGGSKVIRLSINNPFSSLRHHGSHSIRRTPSLSHHTGQYVTAWMQKRRGSATKSIQ